MARQRRPIRIEGGLAYIPLTKGYEAVIDAADAPMVEGMSWGARVQKKPDGSIYTVYATASFKAGAKCRRVYLHRFLMQEPPEMEVDHWDGNGLNNRRKNLRVASTTQNQFNTRIRSDNSSGHKGVSRDKKNGKWRAYIVVNGRQRHLGYFEKKEDAALRAASERAKLHQEFFRAA